MNIIIMPTEGNITNQIQKAFDDCFLAGGGEVRLTKGLYPVGGLRLRSNTTLYLESGAILKASRNVEDYKILEKDAIEPLKEE